MHTSLHHVRKNYTLRSTLKPDGKEYYEYILIYVDDVMAISHDTDRIMKQIKEKLKFKGDKRVESEIYLGANIDSKIHNGVKLWTMSSREYLKSAITKKESYTRRVRDYALKQELPYQQITSQS